MWDWDNYYAVAHYDSFRVEAIPQNGSLNHYKLNVTGYRAVTGEREAGDSLGPFSGAIFSYKYKRHVLDRCLDDYDQMPGW